MDGSNIVYNPPEMWYDKMHADRHAHGNNKGNELNFLNQPLGAFRGKVMSVYSHYYSFENKAKRFRGG